MSPKERKKLRHARDYQGKCFYCSLPLRDDMTWEHLVAQAHKGSDKISNLRVTHGVCNSMVGTLPLPMKFALHEIGWTMGSDAFFLLADRLKPQANAHTLKIRRQRRPKKPPAEQHRATILHLVNQLPTEMRIIRTEDVRAAA
jgi:hypothetical protein